MRREIAPEWRACVGSPYRMSTGQFCPRRCMARLVGPNRIQLGLAAITVLLGGQPRPLELDLPDVPGSAVPTPGRSEEHTSELQSLMRISYAVFCLKKTQETQHTQNTQ